MQPRGIDLSYKQKREQICHLWLHSSATHFRFLKPWRTARLLTRGAASPPNLPLLCSLSAVSCFLVFCNVLNGKKPVRVQALKGDQCTLPCLLPRCNKGAHFAHKYPLAARRPRPRFAIQCAFKGTAPVAQRLAAPRAAEDMLGAAHGGAKHGVKTSSPRAMLVKPLECCLERLGALKE